MKLQIYFNLALLFFASPVFAESSLSAHLHGHVNLNVAADIKTFFFEVHSPSQSFLGFEHRPKQINKKTNGLRLKTDGKRKRRNCFKSNLLSLAKSHRLISKCILKKRKDITIMMMRIKNIKKNYIMRPNTIATEKTNL